MISYDLKSNEVTDSMRINATKSCFLFVWLFSSSSNQFVSAAVKKKTPFDQEPWGRMPSARPGIFHFTLKQMLLPLAVNCLV